MGSYGIENYETLLEQAGNFHGDICAGIQIGTRMTMCGLKSIGINDAKGEDRKKLIVFVEIDRCVTDAIMALTGCRPGKRTMKVKDYGKMAATFINLELKKAVRIATILARKERGGNELPDMAKTPDEELFSITPVDVNLRPEDMPGKPLRRRQCSKCDESILDGREVESSNETLCIPCYEKTTYYQAV